MTSLPSSVEPIVPAALLVHEADGHYRPASADEVLCHARRVLAGRVRRGAKKSSPQAVKDYLRVQIGTLDHEVFSVIFLDAQNRIVALREMFRGTLTQTSVYPREVVKAALELNAEAVLLGMYRTTDALSIPPVPICREGPNRRARSLPK
ncbi:MAG: hypothetical protein F9K36_07600 [Burkholderiaceae bacterium]|nr:MAG: hypothetical protein F9K36_07600 [Burkholderiaceae bacterium]